MTDEKAGLIRELDVKAVRIMHVLLFVLSILLSFVFGITVFAFMANMFSSIFTGAFFGSVTVLGLLGTVIMLNQISTVFDTTMAKFNDEDEMKIIFSVAFIGLVTSILSQWIPLVQGGSNLGALFGSLAISIVIITLIVGRELRIRERETQQ